MLKTTQEEDYAVFAMSVLTKLIGRELSQIEYDFLLVKCYNHPEINPLIAMYLAGSYERAEVNLENLKAKLREVFAIRQPKTTE